MPNPAFEKLKQVVGSAVVAGDKVVRRTAGEVTSRFRSPEPVPVAPPAQPAAAPVGKTAATKTAATKPAAEPKATGPSPASIAKNVAHERPTAKPAPAPKARSTDSPGGKLPPRRG